MTTSRVSSAHSSQQPQTSQTSPVAQSRSGRSTIIVTGRTAKDADDLTYLYITQQQAVGKDPIIEQRFRLESVRLFDYYVRTKHDDPLLPVRLFWGLLYELLVSIHLCSIVYNTKGCVRSIASTYTLFTRRFKLSINGLKNCILASTFGVGLTTIMEQRYSRPQSQTVPYSKQQ